jgi:hypothetical protein
VEHIPTFHFSTKVLVSLRQSELPQFSQNHSEIFASSYFFEEDLPVEVDLFSVDWLLPVLLVFAPVLPVDFESLEAFSEFFMTNSIKVVLQISFNYCRKCYRIGS